MHAKAAEGRVPPLWRTLGIFLSVMMASWMLVRETLPLWGSLLMPLAEGYLRAFEPRELTTRIEMLDDGVTLQFFHLYYSRVPKTPTVDLMALTYSAPIWIGLCAAVPFTSWSRRGKQLFVGWFIILLVSMGALVARVHHQYATLNEEPFIAMFDNWRGWSAYFVNMFFLEVGFFVVPLALAIALQRREWVRVLVRFVPKPSS